MKPKIPAVSLPVLQQVYAAAQKFRSLEPWTLLDDLDLICVRDPATGVTSYGVVIGSGGTIFGYCLYRGTEGFEVYRRLMENEFEFDDIFSIQNCIKVEFGPKSEMEPQDIQIIKRLNLFCKGKIGWPQIRSYLPKYAPWYIDEAEAKSFSHGLQAACYHYEQVRSGAIDESIKDGEYLVYMPADESWTDFKSEWEKFPAALPAALSPLLNMTLIQSLKAFPMKQDGTWEAHMIVLPSSVMDGERPYFVRIPAVCNSSSGFAFQTDPVLPEISDEQALANALCTVIKDNNIKPKTVCVKSTGLKNALTPLANAFGFSLRKKKNLDVIADMKNEMMRFLSRGMYDS
jgi:hypothetical protein